MNPSNIRMAAKYMVEVICFAESIIKTDGYMDTVAEKLR